MPVFTQAKVTVRSATRTPPATLPVVASNPLGMSTANTGTSITIGGDHVPRKPMPYAASTTRSARRESIKISPASSAETN